MVLRRLFTPITRGAAHAAMFLFVFSLVLAGLNLLWTSRQVDSAASKTRAQCRFDADIGAAPISVNPKTGKATLLGVSIISDARTAWHQLGCAGRLGAPAPSFAKWAAYYRLPAG